MEIFVENWIAISGMLIVNVGLVISILGAVKIYSADSPRSDWILESAYDIAERPSYAVIASNGYSPQAEKYEGRGRANELRLQIDEFNKRNKDGMRLIFSGFIIQVVGNMVWGWLYLYL